MNVLYNTDMQKTIFGKIILFIIITILIFLIAGRLNYWQGWVYAFLNMVLTVLSVKVFSKNPELAKERDNPGPGAKWWDKIFLSLFVPLTIIIIIVSVLDAGRFKWTGKLPWYLYVISYFCYIHAIGFVAWSVLSNEFFSSVVRIQRDRNHKVVDIGPYSIIRHPGYAGAVIFTTNMPIILGSLLGLIPSFIFIVLVIIRTFLEDATLSKELPGYKEYIKRVKYRLIPGIF